MYYYQLKSENDTNLINDFENKIKNCIEMLIKEKYLKFVINIIGDKMLVTSDLGNGIFQSNNIK